MFYRHRENNDFEIRVVPIDNNLVAARAFEGIHEKIRGIPQSGYQLTQGAPTEAFVSDLIEWLERLDADWTDPRVPSAVRHPPDGWRLQSFSLEGETGVHSYTWTATAPAGVDHREITITGGVDRPGWELRGTDAGGRRRTDTANRTYPGYWPVEVPETATQDRMIDAAMDGMAALADFEAADVPYERRAIDLMYVTARNRDAVPTDYVFPQYNLDSPTEVAADDPYGYVFDEYPSLDEDRIIEAVTRADDLVARLTDDQRREIVQRAEPVTTGMRSTTNRARLGKLVVTAPDEYHIEWDSTVRDLIVDEAMADVFDRVDVAIPESVGPWELAQQDPEEVRWTRDGHAQASGLTPPATVDRDAVTTAELEIRQGRSREAYYLRIAHYIGGSREAAQRLAEQTTTIMSDADEGQARNLGKLIEQAVDYMEADTAASEARAALTATDDTSPRERALSLIHEEYDNEYQDWNRFAADIAEYARDNGEEVVAEAITDPGVHMAFVRYRHTLDQLENDPKVGANVTQTVLNYALDELAADPDAATARGETLADAVEEYGGEQIVTLWTEGVAASTLPTEEANRIIDRIEEGDNQFYAPVTAYRTVFDSFELYTPDYLPSYYGPDAYDIQDLLDEDAIDKLDSEEIGRVPVRLVYAESQTDPVVRTGDLELYDEFREGGLDEYL